MGFAPDVVAASTIATPFRMRHDIFMRRELRNRWCSREISTDTAETSDSFPLPGIFHDDPAIILMMISGLGADFPVCIAPFGFLLSAHRQCGQQWLMHPRQIFGDRKREWLQLEHHSTSVDGCTRPAPAQTRDGNMVMMRWGDVRYCHQCNAPIAAAHRNGLEAMNEIESTVGMGSVSSIKV